MQQVMVVPQDQLAQQALRVLQVQPEVQVPPAEMVPREPLVLQDPPELMVPQVQPVLQALPEFKVHQVPQEVREQQAA